ncbi:MAG TPA: hypothetical protein VFS96_07880 [Nitrolancea sp.]|nr:hypothetical protein [Nitrolancea sp.]
MTAGKSSRPLRSEFPAVHRILTYLTYRFEGEAKFGCCVSKTGWIYSF